MKLLNTAKKITTAAALVAALLAGTAPKAAAQCPYTVGPLGRYIAPAIVQGMTATDDGAVEVWCTDALDGDDCAGCPFAGVNTCRNQCHEVTAIYNPNLTH